MIKSFDVNENSSLYFDTMISDFSDSLFQSACILTTDTAAHFYERHGYVKALGCKAKNQDEVFVKHLG